MVKDIIPNNYAVLLNEIKQLIRTTQYEALKAVNKELISLYWDIGRMIVERQKKEKWGKSVVERLANDLRTEFPGIQGFSARNIWYMRNFHVTYAQNEKLHGAWQKAILNRCYRGDGKELRSGTSFQRWGLPL